MAAVSARGRPRVGQARRRETAAGAPDQAGVGSGVVALHWLFRVAVAAEFVGHGAFGVMTKAAWVPYFGLFGIPEALAWRLMPLVGAADIILGILALLSPRRAALLYMACWGLFTAGLRPLAGEGPWELLERAGNFGVPLAFLHLAGPARSLGEWLAPIEARAPTAWRAERAAWTLRITAAALLIGHGGFGAFMHKAEWARYLGALGLSAGTVEAAALVPLVGCLELALGLLVLGAPLPGLLLFAFGWKVGTEALRPLTGEPLWEFIERSGSYAALLGLAWIAGAGQTPGVARRLADIVRGRLPAPRPVLAALVATDLLLVSALALSYR